MKPIRTIIVDDEAPARRTIRQMLEQFCTGVFVVGEAEDLPSAQRLIEAQRPELVILDIGLSGASGFTLLERVGAADFQVVFVTAYAHFAVDAFRVEATDYLVKPIDVEQLETAVARVHARRPPGRHAGGGTRLTIASGDGHRFVDTDEVVRVLADGSYSVLYLRSGEEVLVVKKLGQLTEEFPSRDFFRAHRSHLVHLPSVVKIRRGSVDLINGHEVPVSRLKARELRARLRELA